MTMIQTASGRVMDLLNPQAENIHWPDICHALSQICRFTGHTREFYSVAQHSVGVAEIVGDDDAVPYALIHDAHEAFINDLATPLKQAMREAKHNGDESYRMIRDKFDAAIHRAAGLEWPVPIMIETRVKRADMIMLVTESRDLLKDQIFVGDHYPPLSSKVIPLSPAQAQHQLANRLQICLPTFANQNRAA